MEEYAIYHHGIKGQKWGVRRFQNADGSLTSAGRSHYNVGSANTAVGKVPDELKDIPRATRRDASKDAREAAEAKMYYGEGAGTRRKRIKQIVQQRSKDEAYKKAYDYYYEHQDMAKIGVKTRAERKTRDTAKVVKKTTRGIINKILQTGATVSASAAAIYYVAHQTGIDAFVANYAKTKINELKSR